MRLIDADAINPMRCPRSIAEMRRFIDEQPTAYGLYVCDGCKYEPVHPEKSPCRSCGRTMVDYYERGGADDL